MIGIYKITSPSNKIYIGQSIDIEKRFRQYKRLSCKSQVRLYNSIKKYGWDNHKTEIIEYCLLEHLHEREIYWKQIELNKVNNDWSKVLFCGLYDKGGGPRSEETKKKISKTSTGQRKSEKTKQKISQSNKGIKRNLGKHHSEEIKNKISQSNKGKIVSDETKAKKRVSMLGKTASDETKKKMSISALGKPKSEEHKFNMMKNRSNVIKGVVLSNNKNINQYNLEGNFIKEWPSITEAKKTIKGDINACCSGKQKTAGGFIWKFVK